ncbi:MAG: tetratricopeptide repeat protein [Chloroflexota bacterium]|nr:tetratricopeptide repeat protein [Chloroflexota bacterium]
MENNNAEVEALRSEAIDYCNRGDFDKAIAIHRDVLTRYKNDDRTCAYSYASIGDIYLTLRKIELAEDYLRKALGYDPLNPKYHYLLGFTYSVSRQWDRAIKELELSVKQQPKEPEYLRGLGWALWSAGKKAEGLKHLDQAVSLAPDNVNILTDLAAAHLGDGHLDAAQEYAERALRVNPKSTLAKDALNAALHSRESLRAARYPISESYPTIYEMKVRIKGSRPAIWRRFQVSGNITLYKLHRVLQIVMGWSDYHLYEFWIGRSLFSEPDPDFGSGIKSARRIKLSEAITREKSKFVYVYDLGDNWEHEVIVERILPSEKELRHPVCLEGARACPPEDCGGVPGYSDLLKIIRNPKDEEYEELMDWLGGYFNPRLFDLEEVNRRLKHIR